MSSLYLGFNLLTTKRIIFTFWSFMISSSGSRVFDDTGFADAIAQYLAAERAAVSEEIDVLTGYGPFKRAQVEEQD